VFVSLNEDGFHAEGAAKFNVREAVADDQAGGRGDFGEVDLGLLKETGERFAAIAFALIVRAEVEAVDVGAGLSETLIQLDMDVIHVGGSVESEGDAALVGDNKDSKTGLIELGNRFWNAREQVEMLPAGDVLAFRHFAVDDAVAVEENRVQVLGSFLQSAHAAMIAIS